jgi:hypothetical protein
MYSQVTSQVALDDPNCRDYTAQVTIDGLPQTIVGRACQQTDGPWRIAEGPPGQPTQFDTVYAPPSPSYPYYDHYPWLWGPPVGLSRGATVLVIDRDHRFHRFWFPRRHNDFRFSHRHDDFRFGGLHPRFRGFGGTHRGFGFGGPHHGFGGMQRR